MIENEIGTNKRYDFLDFKKMDIFDIEKMK